MTRKTVTFGSVQHEYIDRLRGELLKQGGGENMDLNFTEGVNLAVVIALAFQHADEYRDQHADADLSYDVAAAEIAATYIGTGDVPDFIKDSYGSYADGFVTTMIQTTFTDEPGLPDSEWWDEHGSDHESFNRQFTAEVVERDL